ncbi:MAG: beta-eliminating lyase-related protein [Chloroflexota bacterium]|nr:beta-eliminating lyase-related protein [Chloroflexota bacterium]
MVLNQTIPTKEAIMEACERFLGGHGPLRPHDALRALAAATAPDERADVYGKGDLIEQFEQEIAALLGTEAALFLPTGTMAQQIALRIWAERKQCDTVAYHPMCHVETKEEKGYQRLHGLHARLVGDARRLITRDDLDAIAEPIAALLIELPQRDLGGMLPSWEELTAQTAWAREHGAAVHMDGARLWESAPFYGRSYAEIAGLFDSVYVSFYKGIGAMAGSALAGSADFIAEARVWQVRHGGRIIHLFPYVLSARTNLRQRLGRFPHYHERAVAIAGALRAIPGIAVKPDPPQTHMMHVYLHGNPERLEAASLAIAREENVALFRSLRPTDLPNWSMFELSIGDAADALTDDEIRDFFTRVMTA